MSAGRALCTRRRRPDCTVVTTTAGSENDETHEGLPTVVRRTDLRGTFSAIFFLFGATKEDNKKSENDCNSARAKKKKTIITPYVHLRRTQACRLDGK